MGILKKLFNFLFYYRYWNIGIIEQSIKSVIGSTFDYRVKWLQLAQPGTIWRGDPFGIVRDGALYIFFEEYDDKEGRGSISFIRIKDNHISSPKRVLSPGFHISYPYVFENKGTVYCIPETSAIKEVSLYRAERFPDKWVKVQTLLQGTKLVDPTIFQYDGYWWLFAGAFDSKGVCSELRAWYAQELLGPWVPHTKNPIKVDTGSSRPGGTPFMFEGNLCRPSQDCSEVYGKRVVINKIDRLSPEEFAESEIRTIDPSANTQFRDGFHTLSVVDEGTVLVDGASRVFVGKSIPLMRSKVREILGLVKRN